MTNTYYVSTVPANAPTVPDNAPTVPDNAPTVPDNAPTVPDNAPTVPDNAPTVPDNAPTVSDNVWKLEEFAAAGTLVGTFVVIDADEGQSFRFAFLGGNTDEAFAIDAATGVVTVAKAAALDSERNPVFTLLIQVTDNSHPEHVLIGVLTIQLQEVALPESTDLSSRSLTDILTDLASPNCWVRENAVTELKSYSAPPEQLIPFLLPALRVRLQSDLVVFRGWG